VRAVRTGRRFHDDGVTIQRARLFRAGRVALFVEERANMLGQLGGEKFDGNRVRVRTVHFVGGRDFRRSGVHDALLFVDNDYLLAIPRRKPCFMAFAAPHPALRIHYCVLCECVIGTPAVRLERFIQYERF
jgi:hypothetical protein